MQLEFNDEERAFQSEVRAFIAGHLAPQLVRAQHLTPSVFAEPDITLVWHRALATKGWADVSNMSIVDMARRFEDAGVAALLFTDVGRDGLLTGCNIEATVDLARATSIPVIASGGVAGISDIRVLSLHGKDGIEGVITGRALYDGRLDLATALALAAL